VKKGCCKVTFIALAGLRDIPEFSIFTIMGLFFCFLIVLLGVFRFTQSDGDPSERQSGINIIFIGANGVLFVLLFIEGTHQLFFS
jgi:hypothetical protein